MALPEIPTSYLYETRLDTFVFGPYPPYDNANLTLRALPMLCRLITATHTETRTGRRPDDRTASAAAIGWDYGEARLGQIVATTISHIDEHDRILTHGALSVLRAKAKHLGYGRLLAIAYWGSGDVSTAGTVQGHPVLQPDAADVELLANSRWPLVPAETPIFSSDNDLSRGQVYTIPQISNYRTTPPAERASITTFELPGTPGERCHEDTLLHHLGSLAADLHSTHRSHFRRLSARLDA